MEKRKCNRCSCEDEIPTHQYLRFESKRYEFCGSCWNIFNSWLYGAALKAPKPDPGRVYASGIVTGTEPYEEIVTGREPGKKIRLNTKVMGNFRRWFFAAESVGRLEKIAE